MGIFQRYIKQGKDGSPVLDRNGKPRREGPWFIQYPHSRDPKTGKIKYRTEKGSFSKKKAETMFRAKVDTFQEMEKFGVQIDIEITVSGLMDWGLAQEVMMAKASASDDKTRAGHIKTYLGLIKANQITPLDVDNFRFKMIKTKSPSTGRCYSGTTVNKMVSLARQIYYLAMDKGIVKSNPFARRGTFKEEPKGKYIPDQDFWKIYEYLPEYLQPVILVAYLTGMRRGEIIELNWDRVNLVEYYIDLEPDDTKTNEPRRIYFDSIEPLKNVILEAYHNKKPEQTLVFTKQDGSCVPKWYIRDILNDACKKANVRPFRMHDMRHTFNTNMRKAGVDQVTIMKLTGHKTLEMFLRYSHIDKEQSETAMDKLNSLLSLGNDRNSVDQDIQKNEWQVN